MSGPVSGAGSRLRVVGGAGGVVAGADDLRDLATAYDELGDRVRRTGRAVLGLAADPDLLASAVRGPTTFAEAEAALVAAALGPDGALRGAATWEADAVAVRATAAGLVAADRLAAQAVGRVAHRLGGLLGPGALGPALALGAAASVAAPPLVEPLAALAGGTVDGSHPLLPAGAAGTAGAAGLLAATYGPEGAPVVTRRSDLDRAPAPPRDVADLIGGLAGVAALAGTAPGAVAVDTLVGADGTRRHVVHLPGTDDMTTWPWTRDGDARDLGANLRLASGSPMTYGAGVLRAMAEAGVGPDEPVLITGHSQGGMAATALAAAARSGEVPFDVRQVVTAGSPATPLSATLGGAGARGVEVLALEHRGDPVPHLDGTAPVDAPHRVTVIFGGDGAVPGAAGGAGGADPVDRHGLRHYVAGAAAADASDHPSLVAQRDRLADLGFLDARRVERRVFTVGRDEP
ncbi:hypothetical protein [Nocardioides lentus]|uniref:hypothetical protein n=1 Tax=Nocardioides lentus TaxID=338077 RepID=UPI0031CEE3C6